MPVYIMCGSCGRVIERRPCPYCAPERDRRKGAKRVASGYNTSHWRKLRKQVLERDGHTCTRCGRPATSVHLRPALRANHRLATADDCRSVCHPCHGQIDGGRRR